MNDLPLGKYFIKHALTRSKKMNTTNTEYQKHHGMNH